MSISPSAQTKGAAKVYVGENASPQEGLLSVSVMANGVGYGDVFYRRSDKKHFVVGEPNTRFSIQLRNHSQDGRRMEVVVAIDGHDIITGQEASRAHSGILLEPKNEVTLSAWGPSDSWLHFKGFEASRSFSKYETGIIAVAAFLEDHGQEPRVRGSSPDIHPRQEQLNIELRPNHEAYALPIPLKLGPGFRQNLRPRPFIRSPHRSPLEVSIGYGEHHVLDGLGVLRHAEPHGFNS